MLQAVKDGILGLVTALLIAAGLIMAVSPFLNWALGHGFRWIF